MSYLQARCRNQEYLSKVTDFMIACRGEDPLGGMWDVGDLQWWWREDLYGDVNNQVFWVDDAGVTVGFALVSQEYRCVDYEILPSVTHSPVGQEIFGWGLNLLANMARQDMSGATYTILIREDHQAFRAMAEEAGFAPNGQAYVQTVLNSVANLSVARLPDGYEVRSIRARDIVDGRLPCLRIPPGMYRRVTETPLYRGALHLVVEAPDSRIAAECIGWIDQKNRIGLFEPVRTADEFQRRGVGKAMMATGLRRMMAAGVTLAKVSHYLSNPAAGHLYRSLGFTAAFQRLVYQYSGTSRAGRQ